MTTASSVAKRAIVHRTHGRKQGPITRLMSPGDLGELLKPFVFLDLFSFTPAAGQQAIGMHPHSGIATLTFMMEGSVEYEDTTGKKGVLPAGGVEWMRAGNGVWHTGAPVIGSPVQGFQLWVALPAALENAPAQSTYLAPSQMPQEGPARVLLGRYGAAQSALEAPSSMNYLSVSLKGGERWRYTPPQGHTVGWIAVSAGHLAAGSGASESIEAGELAVFEESSADIDVIALRDTAFVLGSAAKHPHDLVLGYYSVHTNKAALAQGEAEILRIGALLRKKGQLA